MNNLNQEVNRIKLLILLSLMNKINKNDNYNSNKSSMDINNCNPCPSVLIRENLCNGQIAVAMDIEVKFDSTSDYGSINRYVLSGDLLAGKITKTIKLDNSIVIKKEWYHLDHLNSTKATTDEAGKMSTMYEYRAFGEELKKLGSGDAKYTYGGKELDDETNLYYFNARYYDATIGRFINVDPIQDGLNWYVYCNNNPLSFKDPTGLNDWKNIFIPQSNMPELPKISISDIKDGIKNIIDNTVRLGKALVVAGEDFKKTGEWNLTDAMNNQMKKDGVSNDSEGARILEKGSRIADAIVNLGVDLGGKTGLAKDLGGAFENGIKEVKNDDKDLSKLSPDEMSGRQKDVEINKLREENTKLKQENSELKQVKENTKE